jgi:hypothetical protein
MKCEKKIIHHLALPTDLESPEEPVREIGQVSALIWTGLSNVKTNIGFNDALALYDAVEGI